MIAAIRVDNLGKRYLVSQAEDRWSFGYRTLRDDLVRMAKAPFRRLRGTAASKFTDFWALRDVGLEVSPGEAAGPNITNHICKLEVSVGVTQLVFERSVAQSLVDV
jgi:hypothetical protein